MNPSDTPIPANLASASPKSADSAVNKAAEADPLADAAAFDARLKSADELRWLSSRYAPAAAREGLAAIYLLHVELGRALGAREAMLGKIRLQWWRETLSEVGSGGPVRRHDLAQELERTLAGRTELLAALNDLIDRFDDVLDDHLSQGGHGEDAGHADRHLACGAALVRAAGLTLQAGLDAGAIAALDRCGEALLAMQAQMADADVRYAAAAQAVRALPAALWPAVAHLAGARSAGPLGRRWRIFWSMLTQRL